MKIIDKTPFLDDKGGISFSARLQGMLKYGFNWYADVEAQKGVIAQLDRALEKGFVLIRNFTLPNSEIVIPIILIGLGGISVIYVTNVKGFFEAKGDQWNTVSNGRTQPARVNLLVRTVRLARAMQVYLERQKIEMANPVEPVLISMDPGAHIESLRPVARVVMSDAIKPFAASLVQTRPIWRPEFIHTLADRIVNPRPPEGLAEPDRQLNAAVGAPAESDQPAARAKAIFEAAEQAQPANPADLAFLFEEQNAGSLQPIPENLRETSPAQPLPRNPAPKSRFLGMSGRQAALLAVMLILECCVLIGFGIVLTLNQ
jgi:hypothetical protein